MDKYTELEKQAQKFLDETDTMQFSTVELLTMFYNHQEQLHIGGVSKSFNSEEELLQFIYMHTPIAIKPKSKRAKGKLVSAFKSGNAFEQVCKHLAKKLFNVC